MGRRFRLSRDIVLFSAGLGIIIYETVWAEVDRPYLLAIAGLMCGLPTFFNVSIRVADRLKGNGDAGASTPHD